MKQNDITDNKWRIRNALFWIMTTPNRDTGIVIYQQDPTSVMGWDRDRCESVAVACFLLHVLQFRQV